MPDDVLVEYANGVASITINRPYARNAVNLAVGRGISAALDEFESRRDLVVAVITGSGGTFCSGMDLKAFAAGENVGDCERGFAGITVIPPTKPVIAAVEGFALAGGWEIALACDLIVAAEDAFFGLPEVKRGLVAAAGGLLRLPRRLPYSIAMELALTGDLLSAPDAYRHGLVNRLTAPGAAVEGAKELAAHISENGPLAVTATKRIIARSSDWSTDEAFDRQGEVTAPVFASHDAIEGARAFVEKRAPVWRGE